MQIGDYIALGIIVAVVVVVTVYIIKQKKNGVKCIGCSHGKNCGKCAGCGIIKNEET